MRHPSPYYQISSFLFRAGRPYRLLSGALASHRQQFTTPVFASHYRIVEAPAFSNTICCGRFNAIVCILFLCDATAAARLCMSCYQGPCVGMPSPASLNACRACRQPVRGHCLLRSERAWGHEVLVFSRPRKALTDIAIGLLKTVEQERLGFQILMVRRVYAFRISAISTIQCSCHWFCVNRSNLHMLTCRDHSKQVSCFTRFHSLIGFGKLKHP